MPKPLSEIYIHFLDRYHPRRARENGNSNAVVVREATLAFRFALLFSSRVIVPSSSLFEGSLCWQLTKAHPDFVTGGIIEVTSNDADLKEHLERKQSSYDSLSPDDLKKAYREHRSGLMPRFVQKQHSTAPTLIEGWAKFLEQHDLDSQISQGDLKNFKNLWQDMPQILKNRAFIPDHIRTVFEENGIKSLRWSVLNAAIEPTYIRSYTAELLAGIVVDLVALNNPFRFLSNQQNLSYADVYRSLHYLGLIGLITEASSDLLWTISLLPEWEAIASGIVSGVSVQGLDDLVVAVRRKSLLIGSPTQKNVQELDSTPAVKCQEKQPAKTTVEVKREQDLLTSEKEGHRVMEKNRIGALLCAVEIEFQAIRTLLPPPEGSSISTNSYVTTVGDWTIIVKRFEGMGEIDAAIETSKIIGEHQPEFCILVGIAGGFKKQGRELGDVIVADQIIGYELAKLEGSKVNLRPQAFRSSADLIISADSVTRANKWQSRIVVDRPPSAKNSPDVIVGSVLSGNKVVAANGFLQGFRDQWTTVVGIEMEAAGMALAVHRNSIQPQFLMIKSICDFADEDKSDLWQEYAGQASAAFAIEVINSFDKTIPTTDVRAVELAALTPTEKNDIRRRILNDWEEIADLCDIPNSDRLPWKAGREPHGIWQWLADRHRLHELATALLDARRKDILDNVPNLAERLNLSN